MPTQTLPSRKSFTAASLSKRSAYAMHTACRVAIVVALVLLWRSMSLAQSNEVYSFGTSSSTRLTGYRVAVVSALPIWVVGSGQRRFGIEECRYWTDSAGRAIPWPATRVKQPGDRQYYYTRFRLGQASLSLPLPPIGLAFLAGFGVLVLGCIRILHFVRGTRKSIVN
jgi:hypothetical protein